MWQDSGEIKREIAEICRAANREIGLPGNVCKFPVHIFMEKSFDTVDFDAVKRVKAL